MQSCDACLPEGWWQARERLRRKFATLSDDDLNLVPGREESLLEAIARKTGRTRQEVVDAFASVGLFRA